MEGSTFVQANLPEVSEEETDYKEKLSRQDKLIRILRTRIYQLATVFVVFALAIPFLFYYIFFDLRTAVIPDEHSCFVDATFRIPCRQNVTQSTCLGFDCCFDVNTLECFHSYPSRYNYRSSNGKFFPTKQNSHWGTANKPELKLSIVELDSDRVQIVIHEPQHNFEEKTVNQKNYYVKRHKSMLAVDVDRVGSNNESHMILTTGLGPLIASDGYWEWTFRLTNDTLYGLDDLFFENNVTTTKIIYKNRNNHTTVPVFMAYFRDSFHGLIVENSGPIELIILRSKLVVVRCLAGNYISLTLTTGPTPRDVMKQVRGYEFHRPPQWILGPHICRDGLFNATVATEEYTSFLNNINNTINYASDCFHENLYFGYLQTLNETVAELSTETSTDAPTEEVPQSVLQKLMNSLSDLQNRTKLLLSFQPQILYTDENPYYELASELNILYQNSFGQIFNGTYLNQQVAYPDITSDGMRSWLRNVLETLPVRNIAGYVLKDNWPAEETIPMVAHDTLPYLTEDLIESMSFTLSWNSTTPDNVKHIELHNNYGAKQAEVFRDVIPDPILLTSSYYHGLDAVAQIQNVNISWSNLARMIRTTLSHSMLVHPLISVPVCGSTSNYDVEAHEALCMRWYITAATMPIFRISSELPRRDPASLGTRLAHEVAVKAIDIRDALLPYYYTVLSLDDPIMRPMFFDFYKDKNTFTLDQQYMVGDTLLVAQPLLQRTVILRIYLPPEAGVWYEFFGGLEYKDLGWINLSVRESDWFMFIKQGKVLPLRRRRRFTPAQQYAENEASLYTYSIAVALNLTDSTATGSLFLTSSYLTFVANATHVQVQNIDKARADINCSGERKLPSVIESVQVFGIENHVVTTYFNDIDTDLCNKGNTFDVPFYI